MQPALLTRSELEWLQGNKQVSKSFEWKMKSEIRRKLLTFESLELPLLQSRGFYLTANGKALTTDGKGMIPAFDDTVQNTAGFSRDSLISEKMYKRPGRDSNPGRRSDSPPYWTGLYEAG